MAGAPGTGSRGRTGAENAARSPTGLLSRPPSPHCGLSPEPGGHGHTPWWPDPGKPSARSPGRSRDRLRFGHRAAPARPRERGTHAGTTRDTASGSWAAPRARERVTCSKSKRGNRAPRSGRRARGKARPVLTTWAPGSRGSTSPRFPRGARDLRFLSEISLFTFVSSKLEH